MNDDMVAAPGWDTAFVEVISSANTEFAMFLGILIQPEKEGNTVIKQNLREAPENFDETQFWAQ